MGRRRKRMKTCPECGKTMFFDGAEKCTYCGHHFEVQKKITSSPGVTMRVRKNAGARKTAEAGEVRIGGSVRKAMQETDPGRKKTPAESETRSPAAGDEGATFSRYDQQLAALQKQISDSQAMSISLLTSLLAQQNASKTVSQPQPEEKKPERDVEAIIAEMEKRHQEELKKAAEEAREAVSEARRQMEAESEARKAEEEQRIQEMVRKQFEEAQRTSAFIERPEKEDASTEGLTAGDSAAGTDDYDELSALVGEAEETDAAPAEEKKTEDDDTFNTDELFGDTYEQQTSFDDDDNGEFDGIFGEEGDDEDEEPSEETDEESGDEDDDSLWNDFDITGEAVSDDGITESQEEQDDEDDDPDEDDEDEYDEEEYDDDEDEEEDEEPKKKSRRQLRKERKEAKRKAKAESDSEEEEDDDEEDGDDYDEEGGSSKIDILFFVLSLFAPLGILLAIISAIMRKGERALVCLEGVILGVFIAAVAILLNGGQVPSIFGLDKLVSSATEAFFSLFG